jgi:hypothetical protein
MKKKVLLSLVLLTMAGVLVFAQAPTLDKLRFSSSGATTQAVRAANDQISGAVVIPATNEGRTVNAIYASGFRDNTNITSVIIPNSVIEIRTRAFSGCTGLTSITIPASNVNILAGAFENCTNLTSVTFEGTTRLHLANVFPGDLVAKYQAGGPGTYTRQRGSNTWTRQGGAAVCPTCGQNMPR